MPPTLDVLGTTIVVPNNSVPGESTWTIFDDYYPGFRYHGITNVVLHPRQLSSWWSPLRSPKPFGLPLLRPPPDHSAPLSDLGPSPILSKAYPVWPTKEKRPAQACTHEPAYLHHGTKQSTQAFGTRLDRVLSVSLRRYRDPTPDCFLCQSHAIVDEWMLLTK